MKKQGWWFGSFLLAAVMIVRTPAGAGAQDQKASFAPQIEVGVLVSDHRFGSPQRGDRDDYGAGMRVMYNLPTGLRLGGGFGWLRDEFQSRFLGEPEPRAIVNDLYFYSGQIEYAFRSGHNVRPFLGLGLGAATIHSESQLGDLERDATETFPFTPLTAGLEWLDHPADPDFGLQIGIRDNVVWFGEDASVDIPANDGPVNNLEFLAGIALFPGGSAEP